MEMLLDQLQAKELTSGVIFATRKLAMHEGCKSQLLARGIHRVLCDRQVDDDRMKYVVALALSFLCINPANARESASIRESGALDFIVRSVCAIGICQDLNVLYTNLADQKYASSCCCCPLPSPHSH